MAGPAAAAVAMVLAVLVSASGAAHASAAYELRLANTSAIPFHLLDNPFKGGRALLADPKEQWEEWERIGRYSQIANPQMPDKHSSTGQVAIHSVLLPQSYKILVFGRNLPLSGPKSKPEPGVGGNVSTVYDVKDRGGLAAAGSGRAGGGAGGGAARSGRALWFPVTATAASVPYGRGQLAAVAGAAYAAGFADNNTTGTYVVTPNYETLFCAGHTIASDGMVVAAGGDMGVIGGKNRYNFMKEGRDVVRLFDRKTLKWTTLPGVKLSEYRWYPTQVVLPDDRVIIVSGFLDDPGRPTGKPAPSIDIFDYKTKRITVRKSRYDLGKKFFTNITPGYQLYPTVLLLPWTDPDAPDDHFLLMYTCRTGQIVRLTKDNQFLPLWNFPGLEPQGMCAAFSAMGSSVLMPFRPERNYEVEFAMFGGGTQGKGLDCKGICNEPASKYIFRMKLPTVKQALAGDWPKYWAFTGAKQYEEMPWPRVFADAVLLPNGKILVCNGAQRGVPGGTIDGGSTAKQGAYTALLYDPDKPAGKRITTLATSKIHRFYHSNAILLASGDVWIAGSEQGECVDNCKEGGLAPAGQEYRAELLQLPYAFVDRPVITSVSKENVKYGEKITIGYKHGKAVTAATITPPSANTHSTNMMQRVIFLKTSGITPDSITVELPSLKSRVANPGYYMLWILEGDVPAKEARWIKLG